MLPPLLFFQKRKICLKGLWLVLQILKVNGEPDKAGLKPDVSYLSVNLAGMTGHSCCCSGSLLYTRDKAMWACGQVCLHSHCYSCRHLNQKSLRLISDTFRASWSLSSVLSSSLLHPTGRPFPPDLSLLANAVGKVPSNAFPKKCH